MIHQDTICALATAAGMGAIAVIRLSGPEAIAIADRFFVSVHEGKRLEKQKTHTLHYGSLKENDRLFDEVVVSLFRGPNSYTGEDVVELSCHGSVYIQNQILQLLLRNGARMANPGEFTFRAFMNGRMDLSQAEAVADVIASDSEKSHQLALNQMRGGFSQEIAVLRDQLIKFASLIELELDFSTEDVEFADRDQLDGLMNKLKSVLRRLCDSFAIGNVIKNGIPVAIAGEPNVGKSTLLNALLNEERAIVSDIAGTTRDTIEDEMIIEGIRFRFIDTAGIRDTTDTIESLGIEKTYEKIGEAKVVLFLFDVRSADPAAMHADLEKLKGRLSTEQLLVIVANKIDDLELNSLQERFASLGDVLFISAKQKENIQELRTRLLAFVSTGALSGNDTLVSNSRHYEALNKSLEAIVKVQDALAMGLSGDLLAMDIRLALDHLGEITGEITTDDLLDSIFRDFCIGK